MNINPIDNIMHIITDKTKSLFGDELEKVILYGSYARNESNDESDIDIAVLLRCTPEEVMAKRHNLVDATIDIDSEYDVYTSYRVIPVCQWERYGDALELYYNIAREGKGYYERV